jgi:hypothetical protein
MTHHSTVALPGNPDMSQYFTYHLVPVLAPNCKQHILSPAKARKSMLFTPSIECLYSPNRALTSSFEVS